MLKFSRNYWFLVLPFILWLFESLFPFFHPGFQTFYRFALTQKPLFAILEMSLFGLRSLSFYLIIGGIFYGLSRLPFVISGASFFLISYALFTFYLSKKLGPMASAIPSWYCVLIFGLGVASFWGLPKYPAKHWHFYRAFITLSGCIFFLGVTRDIGIESGKVVPKLSQEELPSFTLLSFDGLSYEKFKALPIPFPKGTVEYTRAYSLSNSTYTAWYSILSGKHPNHSGVKSLFPEKRLYEDVFLGKALQDLGYQTVYMTDCGSTAAMSPEMGFSEVHQRDRGILKCGGSLVASLHPLNYLLGYFDKDNFLLPELDTFCSAQYRANNFFNRVKKKERALHRSRRPYFLVVHSCISHQDIFKRPIADSVIPIANDYLAFRESEMPETWLFLLSDHGTSHVEGEISHGQGLSLEEFHVPLVVFAPKSQRKVQRTISQLHSTVDLYPTILKLAGRSYLASDGFDLFDSKSEKRDKKLELNRAFPEKRSELLSGARIDSSGLIHFSEEKEKKLSNNRYLNGNLEVYP